MYDYDRRVAATPVAYSYERVMTAFSREIADKTYQMTSTILELADELLRDLTRYNTVGARDDLKKAQGNLASVARWMTSRHEPEAEPVARFAGLAGDLVEITKFWNRPVFRNKEEHAQKVSTLVQRLYEARKDVVKVFRRSGVWKTSPAFA